MLALFCNAYANLLFSKLSQHNLPTPTHVPQSPWNFTCYTYTHSLIALPPQSFVPGLLDGWPDAVADSRKQNSSGSVADCIEDSVFMYAWSVGVFMNIDCTPELCQWMEREGTAATFHTIQSMQNYLGEAIQWPCISKLLLHSSHPTPRNVPIIPLPHPNPGSLHAS